MDLLTVLLGQDHLTHRNPFAYLLDVDKENIGSMERVKAYLRQNRANERWINILVKDKSSTIRINYFQYTGCKSGRLFQSNRHEGRRFIRGRPMPIILFEPVMEFTVGDVLFFTKLQLCLSAFLPDLD